jgi:LEA14-like dessication related protein
MRNLIAVALLAGTTTIACRSGGGGVPRPPFYRPNVSLRDVKLGGVGLTGGSLEVLINVYNPNGYELATPRVAYRVYVDSVPLARGIFDADIVLDSQDSVKLRIPASIPYTAIGQAGRALLNSGSVNYRVVGDITVGTPYGRYTFPYDRAGWFASLSVLNR